MKTINDYLDDIDTIFYYQTKGVSKKPAVRKVLEELVNSIKLKRNTGLVRTGYYSNDFIKGVDKAIRELNRIKKEVKK